MKNIIYKRIFPSLLRLFKIKKTIKINNFILFLNLENSIEREIYLKREYEKKEIMLLSSICKKNDFDFFLDIGSYIGYFALYIEHNVKIKKIYAFEPNKLNYRLLKNNLKINKSNIKPFNVGLSNSNKIKKMWYTQTNKLGGSSIYFNTDNEFQKYKKDQIKITKIKTNSLDHLFKFKNKKILMKIDVERYELFVILGALKILNNNKIFIMIEIFDTLKKPVFNLLKKNNFKLFKKINSNYFFKNY